MALRQITRPNINIRSTRGWCLKYVDDCVNAPSRKPTAEAAYQTEKRNGNTRSGEPPVGVWVPIWFSLTRGPYAGLGHVAWAFNRGNSIEIHDSEVHAGARGPYSSIQEVLNWFSGHGIVFNGWSLWVDGRQIVEAYEPTPPAGGRQAAKGTATVLVSALNVRNAPSRHAGIAATYVKGQSFTYDSWISADGFIWLSYVSRSGVRRFVAEGPDDGRNDTVYVSGGV